MTDRPNAKRDQIIHEAFGFRDSLLSYAYGFLRDWTAAEDVVQDTFIIVIDKCEDWEEGTNLFAWTRKITWYNIQTYIRKNRKYVPVEDQALLDVIKQALDDNLNEEQVNYQKELRSALQHCIGLIDKNKLRILEGFYWQRLSCDQLAEKFRYTSNATRKILYRLRNSLRGCVQGQMCRIGGER